MDVCLHAKDDSWSVGFLRLRSIATDENEGVVDGAGRGHNDDVANEVECCHLYKNVVYPLTRLTTDLPVFVP